MKLTYSKGTIGTIKADSIIVFTFQDENLLKETANKLDKFLNGQVSALISAGDFKGKEKEIAVLYPTNSNIKSKRVILSGLGEVDKVTLEKLRRSTAVASKKAQSLKSETIAIEFPDYSLIKDKINESLDYIAQSIAEGSVLALYKFDKYLTDEERKNRKVREVIVFSEKDSKEIREGIRVADIVCSAVYFARDLANAPASEIYPETLAKAAVSSGKKYGYKVKVLGKPEIEKLGMGGLLAVNSGSAKPPRFIIMEYNGNPRSKERYVIVGKGITFDSGGISIKPAQGMDEMKMDMSGAAAVIATMEAVARLKLPVNLVGLVPATENMPSGSAYKPGDILKTYIGKTIEVDNTDAEGRIILADALGYAQKYKPTAIIDLATLTGACVVALGYFATGMFGNDEKLMEEIKKAGEKTYERVWQLPTWDEYDQLIKSDVADVKNTGGRWAGAITAAKFLQKFVGNYPWVHLDIAGTAMLDKEYDYQPKGGSGVGVRLLVEFFRNKSKNK
ncbi:leucyl aminopeptidase [Candidatus Kryptobacter tengchongensis]|nr:leucyl aminopeptidase [Candidatus Kryptobacter tengchongensis]